MFWYEYWKNLKEFNSHNGEIIEMLHSNTFFLLISLSNDGILKFQSDKSIFDTEIIKEIELIQSNVSSISLS